MTERFISALDKGIRESLHAKGEVKTFLAAVVGGNVDGWICEESNVGKLELVFDVVKLAGIVSNVFVEISKDENFSACCC